MVGWSEVPISNVLNENTSQEIQDIIHSFDSFTMPATDITLYAVWAKDANKNGSPDYNDNSVHVKYHSNKPDKEDQVISCLDHHVPNEPDVRLTPTAIVQGMNAHYGGSDC